MHLQTGLPVQTEWGSTWLYLAVSIFCMSELYWNFFAYFYRRQTKDWWIVYVNIDCHLCDHLYELSSAGWCWFEFLNFFNAIIYISSHVFVIWKSYLNHNIFLGFYYDSFKCPEYQGSFYCIQNIRLFQHHLLKRLSFPPLNSFGTFVENELTIYVWVYS